MNTKRMGLSESGATHLNFKPPETAQLIESRCKKMPLEPRKKPQCIVYVRELYYITFAKEKCLVAKDRESNLLRERSRKRSLRYFKLFVLFSGNGPVGMDGKLTQEV